MVVNGKLQQLCSHGFPIRAKEVGNFVLHKYRKTVHQSQCTHKPINPSIHLLLSSKITTRVRRCRPFGLVLLCWWSGFTEVLVVVKTLLVERLVAVLTLDPWCGRVTLSLMVSQTCLVPSLEGAAWVAAV